MKVMLLGGTGVISSDVARAAIESGADVFLLNRGSKSAPYVEEDNIITADIRDLENIKKLLLPYKFDVVVDFLSYNVSQLMKTMEAFRDKCEQFIFISSATVYSRDEQKEPITEKKPTTNTKWIYPVNKIECEKFLAKNAMQYGFNYTIIRPYVTYSEKRIPFPVNSRVNQWMILGRILANKPVVMWGDGCAICTLTNSVDFANALVKTFLNCKCYGEAYHLTSDENMTWKEVLNIYYKILGRKPNVVNISSEKLEKLFPELTHELTGDKSTSFIFDNSKLKEAVGGFSCDIKFEQGVKRSVDYYIKESNDKIDYAWDAKVDYIIQKEHGIKLKFFPYKKGLNVVSFIVYYLNRHRVTQVIYYRLWVLKTAVIFHIKKKIRLKRVGREHA